MLSMGSSRPWPDAMEVMTGQRELDAGALLEYFKPLEDWLVQTNADLGVEVGWRPSQSKQTSDSRDSFLHRLLSVFFQKSIAQSHEVSLLAGQQLFQLLAGT
jgi:Angiotensin-converting enzyme